VYLILNNTNNRIGIRERLEVSALLIVVLQTKNEVLGNHHNLAGIGGGGVILRVLRMQRRFFKVIAMYQFSSSSICDSQDSFHSVNEYTYRDHHGLGADGKTRKRSDSQ